LIHFYKRLFSKKVNKDGRNRRRKDHSHTAGRRRNGKGNKPMDLNIPANFIHIQHNRLVSEWREIGKFISAEVVEVTKDGQKCQINKDTLVNIFSDISNNFSTRFEITVPPNKSEGAVIQLRAVPFPMKEIVKRQWHNSNASSLLMAQYPLVTYKPSPTPSIIYIERWLEKSIRNPTIIFLKKMIIFQSRCKITMSTNKAESSHDTI